MTLTAKNQGGATRRRIRWRRDDAAHLELYQEQADLAALEVDLKYYDLGMESRDALTSVQQDRP